MKICKTCGKRNLDKDKFCGECGNKLSEPANYCPKCNKTYNNGNKFCTQCGTKLVVKSDYLKPNSPKKYKTIKSHPSAPPSSKTIKRQSDISNKDKSVNKKPNIQKNGPSAPPDNFIENLIENTKVPQKIVANDGVSYSVNDYSYYTDSELKQMYNDAYERLFESRRSGDHLHAQIYLSKMQELKRALRKRGYRY